MNILICGAGAVGTHAAETLTAARNSVTVIDHDGSRLRELEDTLDVAVFQGNCVNADALLDAGCADADLVVAATNVDEINLLTASVAKGLGAIKTIARIHESTYFAHARFNYQRHFDVDRLICPEYSTALGIARTLRNPGAMAIEDFARGGVEMQEFPVGKRASASGMRLMDASLPAGTRVALIRRKGDVIIPEATSVVVPGDDIVLVGNAGQFEDARRRFHDAKISKRKIVIMGGPPMAVWLCEALRDRHLSIRLFETDRDRAQQLAEQLDWVTVLQADPTDRAVFDEEHLAQADVFIGLLGDDEANIIGCVLAKTNGVLEVFAVVEKARYLDLLYHIGVDRPFSPRVEAAKEIEAVIDERPIRHVATLSEGVDVFRVRVDEHSEIIGKALKEVSLTPDWIIAAAQHGDRVFVPGADDKLWAGDVALVIGRKGQEKALKNRFLAK